MAFGEFISEERIPTTPPPLRMVEKPRLDTPEQRLQAAAAHLAEAQHTRDNFYDVGINGTRLDIDQKSLLTKLRDGFEDKATGQVFRPDDLAALDHVEHTDQDGKAYTFADYFAHDAPDILVVVRRVVTDLARARDVHAAAVKAVEMAKHAPAERASGTVQPLGESASAFEARFHETWVSENDAARMHLDRIRAEFMTAAKKMPFSEPKVMQEVAPADPFVQLRQAPAPAPVSAEVPNPYAFASPDAQTVVMPRVEVLAPAPDPAPKPKRWYERLAS